MVASREREIEQRVRERLVREVREEQAAREVAWEATMDERFSRMASERSARVDTARDKVPTPQLTPERELGRAAIAAQMQQHIDHVLRSIVPILTGKITSLEDKFAALLPSQPNSVRSTPAPAAAPAPPSAPQSGLASTSSAANTASARRSGLFTEDEDVKPSLNCSTNLNPISSRHSSVAASFMPPPPPPAAANLERRLRDLERRLGLAALDARDADKPSTDQILPPGKTVADVLEESSSVLAEVVNSINCEFKVLEDRIAGLERGAVLVGVDPVAAEMDFS